MKADVAVGDEVVLHGGFREARRGKVVKIGTKLVHVDNGVAYYRDTQQRRDGYSGGFKTLAQHEESKLLAEALAALRAVGIEIDWRHRRDWTTADVLALREFVRTLELEPSQ